MSAGNYVKTPRGCVYTVETRNGRVTARLEYDPGFAQNWNARFHRKQSFIDSECMRLMAPETPRLTGMLIKTATLGTVVGSGMIRQIAPYARRQYYTHRTKSHWFQRMANRHRQSILRGAEKV